MTHDPNVVAVTEQSLVGLLDGLFLPPIDHEILVDRLERLGRATGEAAGLLVAALDLDSEVCTNLLTLGLDLAIRIEARALATGCPPAAADELSMIAARACQRRVKAIIVSPHTIGRA